MATALVARHGRSTLVHRRPLLEQWIKRLSQFLDLDPGQIGSPTTKPGSSGIDVAMIKTLTRRDNTEPLDRYGHVIVDDCHHVPAVSVERLLRHVTARRITGLTATPRRRDGHHPIIAMQCGPIRHTLTSKSATATAVRRLLVERRTAFDPAVLPTEPGIQEILGAIAADHDRTTQVADDVLRELAAGRFPLVLTERREYLDALAALLEPKVPRLVILHGGMGVRARRHAEEVLGASDEPRIVLATSRYIGEGFDDSRLDTLVLAMPIAWKGTMTQYVGRLHRHHDANHEIRILDHEIPYCAACSPSASAHTPASATSPPDQSYLRSRWCQVSRFAARPKACRRGRMPGRPRERRRHAAVVQVAHRAVQVAVAHPLPGNTGSCDARRSARASTDVRHTTLSVHPNLPLGATIGEILLRRLDNVAGARRRRARASVC